MPQGRAKREETPVTRETCDCFPLFCVLEMFHDNMLEKIRQPRQSGTDSSVLAWRIPGTAEPGGLLPMGLHRVGHD